MLLIIPEIKQPYKWMLSVDQGCGKVSLRPAGAGEKEAGGRPQAPRRGGCPFEPRFFLILQQPCLYSQELLLSTLGDLKIDGSIFIGPSTPICQQGERE